MIFTEHKLMYKKESQNFVQTLSFLYWVKCMSNLKEYAAATSGAKAKSTDAFRMYIFVNSFYSYIPKKLVAIFQKIAASIIINLLLCLPGFW